MKNKTPFFIVGSERSGTTMLRLMLNMHPRLCVPKESHFIYDLNKAIPIQERLSKNDVESTYTIITDSKRWQQWSISKENLWEQFTRLDQPTLADIIDATFTMYAKRSEKVRWGDKTPKYVFLMPEIKSIFPSAKFVNIVRDGRDVAISMLKTNWYGQSIRVLAKKWITAVSSADDFACQHDSESYLRIYYEKLVSDPPNELKKVSNFLLENYDDRMLDFYESASKQLPENELRIMTKTFRPPDATDLQRWKHELKKSQVFVFEAMAGTLLKKHGYELRYGGLIWLIPIYLCKFIFFCADLTLPIRNRLGIHFPYISDRF